MIGLAPVGLLLTLLTGCDAPESPFLLWHMRIGMPLAELDSISLHDQSARFTCTSAEGGFQRCTVPVRGSSGRMDALLDPADRVVELTYSTGLERSGLSPGEMVGLINATQQLVKDWNQVVEPVSTGFSLDDLADTWRAGDGRWRARIDWWGTSEPRIITITDEEAVRGYNKLVAVAAEEAMRARSPSAEAARVELRRLTAAQHAYRSREGTYAADLGALRFSPLDGVVVEIGGAESDGWWAKARTEGGGECVVWEGTPPSPEAGRAFGGTAGEPDCG